MSAESSTPSKLGLGSLLFLVGAMSTYIGAHIGHHAKGERTDYRYEVAGGAIGFSAFLAIIALGCLAKCLYTARASELSNPIRHRFFGEPAETDTIERGLLPESSSERLLP